LVSWEREYIVQTFVTAANNLSINSHRLLLINLVKEFLYDCEDLDYAISEMKKITVLSKFAVRIGLINKYTKEKPDFFNVSSKFNSDYINLIPVVNELLDSLNSNFLVKKFNEISNNINMRDNMIINEDTSYKEGYNFEDGDFNEKLVNHIKWVDSFLNRFEENDASFMEKVDIRAELLLLNHFAKDNIEENLVEMFEIFRDLLLILVDRDIQNEELVESLRASMIVLVATIKHKEIDFEPYVKRARAYFEKKTGK
jgi:hypothetical protein